MNQLKFFNFMALFLAQKFAFCFVSLHTFLAILNICVRRPWVVRVSAFSTCPQIFFSPQFGPTYPPYSLTFNSKLQVNGPRRGFRWFGLFSNRYMCMWKDCSLEAPPKSTYAKSSKHMDNKSYFTQFLLVPCKTKWVGNRGMAKLAQVFGSFEL